MIEWAAAQEWSSGNVGLIGVSALAKNQYYTASKLLTEESANIL
jgi:predicted acyl esterase